MPKPCSGDFKKCRYCNLYEKWLFFFPLISYNKLKKHLIKITEIWITKHNVENDEIKRCRCTVGLRFANLFMAVMSFPEI